MLVVMQLRLVRLLLELLIEKKITEPAEAQALLYRHAEGLRAVADRVGVEALTYHIAKQFEFSLMISPSSTGLELWAQRSARSCRRACGSAGTRGS